MSGAAGRIATPERPSATKKRTFVNNAGFTHPSDYLASAQVRDPAASRGVGKPVTVQHNEFADRPDLRGIRSPSAEQARRTDSR
jgi:hypothetical protein